MDALLSIKVCDPACGSGHFLLAAARKIALRLAQEQTGEENPGREPLTDAMHRVIRHCIYGVDKNPADLESHTGRFAEGMRAVEALQGDDLDQVREQKKRYEAFRANKG